MHSVYLELKAEPGDGDAGHQVHAFIRDVAKRLNQGSSYEHLFEVEGTDGSFEEAVIRLTGLAGCSELEEALRAANLQSLRGIAVRWFPEVEEHVAPAIDQADVQVAYYRPPGMVDSRMALYGESCVELVHIPSGITARCEMNRNRHRNYACAMRFLQSQLEAFPQRSAS